MARPRRFCPVCNRIVAVNMDGRIARHPKGAVHGCRGSYTRAPAPEKVVIKDMTSYDIDRETGRLIEMYGEAIQAMVDVRSQVREAAMRELLIAELERLGYTVLAPKESHV
jgi:hypothetical protein